ncbi:hypothetical protein DY000_02040920 [Brassica cretica]|uniref:Uncharacterized protein n=1 Tax=Brassica cretica TaxID=69181 RepID=A0ABQ7BHP0_BRACR|nr:hypothetical protein DY000_02040920 [Brassica cretica]
MSHWIHYNAISCVDDESKVKREIASKPKPPSPPPATSDEELKSSSEKEKGTRSKSVKNMQLRKTKEANQDLGAFKEGYLCNLRILTVKQLAIDSQLNQSKRRIGFIPKGLGTAGDQLTSAWRSVPVRTSVAIAERLPSRAGGSCGTMGPCVPKAEPGLGQRLGELVFGGETAKKQSGG